MNLVDMIFRSDIECLQTLQAQRGRVQNLCLSVRRPFLEVSGAPPHHRRITPEYRLIKEGRKPIGAVPSSRRGVDVVRSNEYDACITQDLRRKAQYDPPHPA